MREQVLKILRQFYEDNKSQLDDEESTLSNSIIWNSITCELYFVITHKRCRYMGGQEFPEYKFNICFFCPSFKEFPEYIEELADEICRVAEDRQLETLVISDRLYDGYIDTFIWES